MTLVSWPHILNNMWSVAVLWWAPSIDRRVRSQLTRCANRTVGVSNKVFIQ